MTVVSYRRTEDPRDLCNVFEQFMYSIVFFVALQYEYLRSLTMYFPHGECRPFLIRAQDQIQFDQHRA